jgi:hypothetical protein
VPGSGSTAEGILARAWTGGRGREPAPHLRRPGRRVKKRNQVWLYALGGFKLSSVAWVRETYRKRFRIELS